MIPDPTEDLDWSGYVGSIQEHFGENARKYPDRVCVVETKSLQSPERTFTYKQIYEASNTLAHYLHQHGIANGDVVMIYAHRSIDLVIAIMGTLASAATMSVLDPLYPPNRQQVYLEVAQPRALVNIARATAEAGPLDASVRRYLDEELQLKAEIPSLRIDDSGILYGGEVSGHDVLADARSKAASPPDTLVGPDSNPTLSFTSGSEGKPKGVLGRHFSLAKYFGWMAERFELSSRSKFTMLSGIAHDPIQRDIFTPLFLGAQLLIPTKEDIQHEKLAEWMREYEPTVTHLTPAMGQILVGGATAQFPSLEKAFFVGDVLTKRDCNSLRELASNVNIVNMYGTTETQRAVSYYEIPSRAKDEAYLGALSDTIPAGQGMQNVQLLVVDRGNRDRICQVGEVGEIYVRAAGLAEGYKGDKELNDQKFLMNWFLDNETWVKADEQVNKNEPWRNYYKGPRDRLYRTGDLGRYRESGDVECTGRADDQVKIRGFRFELNEIDNNLSQNPLIRDCKTLVRRDRNEEASLVSYIVPELKRWPEWLETRDLQDVEEEGTDIGPTKVYFKRFRPIQTEVRDYLQGLLPWYAVPTVFIVLNKLPLNPNGKVDKPNLPFPDITMMTEEASEEDTKRWNTMTETQRLIASRWADLLTGVNPKTIKLLDSFFQLGGHSILAQQMMLDIRKQIGVDVSINKLYEYPTLADFSAQIDYQQGKGDEFNGHIAKSISYAQSFETLRDSVPPIFQPADPAAIQGGGSHTVLLTGATGFLGAYIIKDTLERKSDGIKLVAHVRGVKDPKAAYDRLRRSLKSYGLWQDDWSERISCVVGDLSQPRLGIDASTWERLSQEVDVVIHNGATVHWVKRYQDMKAANVESTIDAMRLCNEGKSKLFTYVSSTSVLDTDHYVNLSNPQDTTGQNSVSEEDDLEGSRTDLGTGYGQTKWVSEQLLREAGKRGLRGSIIRPGYILGDSENGVCNSDDFLVRMLKGCVQLRCRPSIDNAVNAVPVNHVARVCVAAALHPLQKGVHVVHVNAKPRLRMNEYLAFLSYYGYEVPEVSYDAWKEKLEQYVSAGGGQERDQEQHALMPLYHFCVNDLPATTKAPQLNDVNAVRILQADAQRNGVEESAECGVTKQDVGKYLRYLTEIKFLPKPTGKGQSLPEIAMDAAKAQLNGVVGGRGGTAG